MNRLSMASIIALVGTIILGLAFLTMPLITAPVIENDAFVLTEEGDTIYESITALSITFDNAPELEYSLPSIGLLSFSVLIAVLAMAASFVPAITRTSRYVLMLAGLLALFGFFAIPLQIIETELTNYAQMLGYGFWIGVLASMVLIGQGVMGSERDPITDRVSKFAKNIHITRQQVIATILLVIGLATLYQGVTSFPPEITEFAEAIEAEPFEYEIRLLKGDDISFAFESEDFVPMLSIFRENDEQEQEEVVTDDSGMLRFIPEVSGNYTIVVGSVDGDESAIGDFELTTNQVIQTRLNFEPHGFRDNPEEADPLQMIVPTGMFLTVASLYFIAVGVLGIANIDAVKRVMPILMILSAVIIFLVLLVGTAAGGSTNATTMITESLRAATPIAIGAMAGIWCERSGVINIAIEGMMLFGACIGFTTLFLLQAWYPDPNLITLHLILGVSFAVLSGGLVSLLHAWLSITFSTDQIVSGTVINILALGSTSYIRSEVLLSSEAGLNKLPIMEIPIFSKLPVIGPIFASQPIFYLMFVVIILTHIMLYQTRWGLRTIAVGENPHAADTLGINVNRIRWINVFIGGMIAGLAGAWFSLEATGRFTDGMTDGKGFISLAAMIFGKWTPAGSFGGSLLFGFSETLGLRFQILNVALPPQFLQMVPYLVTLIVLAGLVGRAIPPKAVGQPYKTEGSR